jgi:hypothetical protein
MAVLLDDGRSVAFDVKDYAAVDHGYAATIHRAQGMTVDRVHVLATPGLDRHAAYVALSRHRERVDLHYGQDDFADRDRLVRTLARERGKDMASDYGRDATAPSESLLTAIKPRDRETERGADQARTRRPELESAVTRHGEIVRTIRHLRSLWKPVTPEQRAELAASRAALDALTPKGAQNLEAAFANDLPLIREAAEGRTARTIQAMQLESEMRTDPQLRADTFVQRWQALDHQRRRLLSVHETTAAGKVADRMIGMAKGLERDPQVESLLSTRKAQLGLPEMPGRGVGEGLADMIGRTRSRGLEIGM